MPRLLPSRVLRFIASIPVIVLLTAHSPALAQQKNAPPSPHSQAQLEDRVKELETRLNAAEQKAASAAMEKDYITRIQKQYESYYKEVLSTQTWTLGIFGLILTGLFAVASKFSIDLFDSRTKAALDAALAQVEKKFSEQMQKELETLRLQNAAKINELNNTLTARMGDLEKDLKTRSTYQHNFAQALTLSADQRYADARIMYRAALKAYKFGKARQVIPKRAGVLSARNLFLQFQKEDEANSVESAKKELAQALYNDLEDELALAAVRLTWLTPLLEERKQAPSAPVAEEPKTEKEKSIEPPFTATPNDDE